MTTNSFKLTSSLSSFCFNFSKSSFLSWSSPMTAFKLMANCCDFSVSLLLQLCPAPPLPLPVVCLHFRNNLEDVKLSLALEFSRTGNLDSPSRSAIARYATAFTVMFAAELSTAATTTKIVWAHLALCRPVVTSCSVHLKVGTRSLSILICIPGCFKLNYFCFIFSSLIYTKTHAKVLLMMTMRMIRKNVLSKVMAMTNETFMQFFEHQLRLVCATCPLCLRLQQNSLGRMLKRSDCCNRKSTK